MRRRPFSLASLSSPLMEEGALLYSLDLQHRQ
jgi:hypothetical protein